MKVTENVIEENQKEERVINLYRKNQNIVKENRRTENQLIAPLGRRPDGRVLNEITQMCSVITSHLNTYTLAYNKNKICWEWSCTLLSVISTLVIIHIQGFTS